MRNQTSEQRAQGIIYTQIFIKTNKKKVKLSSDLILPHLSFTLFFSSVHIFSFLLRMFSVSGLYSCAHRVCFHCTVGPFTGPFGPQPPSKFCLCQNPALHWTPAAEGAKKTERRGEGGRNEMWKV